MPLDSSSIPFHFIGLFRYWLRNNASITTRNNDDAIVWVVFHVAFSLSKIILCQTKGKTEKRKPFEIDDEDDDDDDDDRIEIHDSSIMEFF